MNNSTSETRLPDFVSCFVVVVIILAILVGVCFTHPDLKWEQVVLCSIGLICLSFLSYHLMGKQHEYNLREMQREMEEARKNSDIANKIKEQEKEVTNLKYAVQELKKGWEKVSEKMDSAKTSEAVKIIHDVQKLLTKLDEHSNTQIVEELKGDITELGNKLITLAQKQPKK